MKLHIAVRKIDRLLCQGFWLFLMLAALPAAAVEVWDGPVTNFSKPNFADSMQPINQDRITPNVWLTRDSMRGLYNIALEPGYISYSSPEETEWAYGTLADYDSLSYQDWQTWNGSYPPGMVGQNAVLHLITDDIYMSIRFTYWAQNSSSGGGFSYDRSTPATVPEPAGTTTFVMGLILAGTAKLRRSRIERQSGTPSRCRCANRQHSL